ncbi:MAG: hypothetical protein H6815_11870 [Phycisphaeraceae bacterium]|nr:hypothetical protein [Phycisphaerales bacterium]MCB9861137.1 hypothetical protein [Phycisphaeraceae bacterium]
MVRLSSAKIPGFRMVCAVLLVATAAWMIPVRALAQPDFEMLDGNSLVHATLIAEQDAVRAGSTVDVGILLDIEPGWHTYWNGKNDTGFPVSVSFELPNGVRADALQWPVPKRHLQPGDILDFVYEDKVLLISTIHVPEGIGEVANLYVKANVEWLVCKEACLPGSAELETYIPITRGETEPPRSKHASLFAQMRETLPRKLPKPGTERALEMELRWNDSSFLAVVPNAKIVRFFPGNKCANLVSPIQDTERRGEDLEVRLETDQLKSDFRLQGVLSWEYPDGTKRMYMVDFPWGDTKGYAHPE